MRTLLLLTLLISGNVYAESERYYQHLFCNDTGGISEVTLSDRTRVDCLTFGMAIEVEFASKWKNSIGQAVHYARMTDRQPGIALIMVSAKDCKYLDSLKKALVFLIRPISMWEIGPYAGKCT